MTIVVDKASVTSDINLTRTKYDLGESGLSGRVTAPRSVVFNGGDSVVHSLDSLVVYAEINGKDYSVLTDNGNYDSDTAGSFSVNFSLLGVNEKVEKGDTTEIIIKVFSKDPIDSSLKEQTKTTLDLNKYYSNKDSVNLNIDPWIL